MLKSQLPGPVNVSSMGNKVFADDQVNKAIRAGPNPIGLVSLKEVEIWTHRQTCTQGGHVEMKAKGNPLTSHGLPGCWQTPRSQEGGMEQSLKKKPEGGARIAA